MKKLQLPHLLFAPQIRGSLSAIGGNQGVKKRRGQRHGTMNSWLLNDIFHTGAGMFTYNYHQNQLNVQTTPKTEEMWTISLKWFPIKVPFNKLNHTNFLVNHISNTILLCQPRTPPTLVFWMILPKKKIEGSNPIKIEGQTWGFQESSGFFGRLSFLFFPPLFFPPLTGHEKNAARFPVWTAFKSASLLVTAPRSSFCGRGGQLLRGSFGYLP